MSRAVSEDSVRLAVRNVARWGDTDLLPFPLENHWFYDAEDEVVGLLQDFDADFDVWTRSYPLQSVRGLTSVGYTGYRPATQIDPIWNAYLLALAIELGPEIEANRVPISDQQVFSYRFAPDAEAASLFDSEIGWHTYQQRALELAPPDGIVLATDISDFYPRIYHHRIENALKSVTGNQVAVGRIMSILTSLSAGVSYGLPIGGNAARILAEAVLNRTDRLLLLKGVQFCRFVDDYLIFAESEEIARRDLVHLSQTLMTHEGLSLSRSKTRLMSYSEFRSVSPAAMPDESESDTEHEARRFLRIRLKYDPYSPTGTEDFEQLAEELQRFDIVGMLARELRKSRIDQALTKQLIRSLRFLDEPIRADAVETLVQNLGRLFPIFSTVAIVLRAVIDDLPPAVQQRVFETLRSLITSDSHIVQVPAHLAFVVRLLARDPAAEVDVILSGIYDRVPDVMIRRDVILAMVARESEHWLADRLKDWANRAPWERRALIPGTYVIGEEGSHWRKAKKKELSQVDRLFLTWVASKNNGVSWRLPT